MAEGERPKVGVGVVVFRDGKILLCQRKGAHGGGQYAGPGGHLEFGETFEECVARETREEAGIEIKNICILSLSALMWPSKHYVDIGFTADWEAGEPRVCEPDKCAGWNWYDLDNLPSPLFGGLPTYIEALRTGKMYFGSKKLKA